MEDVWKSIALLMAGLVTGGVAGVIRGDWLGTKAANGVKEQLQLQIALLRTEQEKLEVRLKEDLKGFVENVEEQITKHGAKLDEVSRRLHDANQKILAALLKLGLDEGFTRGKRT